MYCVCIPQQYMIGIISVEYVLNYSKFLHVLDEILELAKTLSSLDHISENEARRDMKFGPKVQQDFISKGCWHYDTYVVLDGNPLISDDKLQCRKVHAIICREKFIPCREKFTHFYADLMQRKVHALICRENFISCREKFTHFYAEKSLFHVEKKFTHFYVGELTFGPWQLVLGI